MFRREAFYLDTPGGQRFAVVTRPRTAPKGALVYVHPFAEEMNKSRRMAALTAQALAGQGWLVFQGDLKGCGDSAADFGDATWRDWLDDLSAFWGWLEDHCDVGVRALWGLRAGCLVVTEWLAQRKTSCPLLLWQPTPSGERHLVQFLRLKAVNEALNEADRGGVKQLRDDLAGGKAVEVAGYVVRPELASGLAAARLRLDAGFRAPVTLIEVASGERRELTPAVAALAQTWRSSGIPTFDDVVAGPAFWQTVEVETAPALTTASLGSAARLLS